MHRGGSGRDLAGFPPAAAAATATDEQRRNSTYAAAYPYDYSESTTHVYADYSDYGQYNGADYAQQGAVVEADAIPPPGDGGHQIPYGEDPQFPPYASNQHIAQPPQPHDLHHRGTDDPTTAEIKPFVYKIFAMLSDPERYQDVILWAHTGEAFFVAHNDRFVNEVLREQFQHTNIHSFTRAFCRLALKKTLSCLSC
ncbi:hypothetical protein RHOSPDRAFT_27191 [Rhodotorula sp. JG-1b]|nr:hypothetical protein RHOSPDRAFT_27191 [Rhodotorula sp. JG-1b]